MSGNAFGSPVPLSDIESVLAWVDNFKLSRPTKKINRDFSDAVLLAEILAVHYPKLVEMHNYPPRNSHALKLNNWMTLNRKVLKKLKLTLCSNTMEQLSNCTPGVIERVLMMVRDKIKHDEEVERANKEQETNQSSGGSYYEAYGDEGGRTFCKDEENNEDDDDADTDTDKSGEGSFYEPSENEENVLVVPVKTRVNGVLETIQQKVVSYDAYSSLKQELKDAKDANELLKQKVEHLDSLIKLKDERITELQKQMDRKQSRRNIPPPSDVISNSISAPFEDVPSPTSETITQIMVEKSSVSFKSSNISNKIELPAKDSKNATPKGSDTKIPQDNGLKQDQSEISGVTNIISNIKEKTSFNERQSFHEKPSIKKVSSKDNVLDQVDIERIKSDLFKEANDDRIVDEVFKDSEPGITTIEETIKIELIDIKSAEQPGEFTKTVVNKTGLS